MSDVGLRVWAPGGKLLTAIDYRLSRYLGEITPGPGAGSIDVAAEHGVSGDAWFWHKNRVVDFTGGARYRTFSVSGSTISWTASSDASSGPTIVYGVY
jgi:hypothetical protein